MVTVLNMKSVQWCRDISEFCVPLWSCGSSLHSTDQTEQQRAHLLCGTPAGVRVHHSEYMPHRFRPPLTSCVRARELMSLCLLCVQVLGVHINKWTLDKRLGLTCLFLYSIFLCFSCLIEYNIFTFVNLPTCREDWDTPALSHTYTHLHTVTFAGSIKEMIRGVCRGSRSNQTNLEISFLRSHSALDLGACSPALVFTPNQTRVWDSLQYQRRKWVVSTNTHILPFFLVPTACFSRGHVLFWSSCV